MIPFLNNFFASAFWFVVVVGILVFLHEAGHFLTAKFFGMKVEVFSLGFGRRIFGRRRGETDYRLSLIPLGGYVKLAGGEEAGEASEPVPPDYFLARPRWQRFLVLVMGATVNLVLAVVVFAGAFVIGLELPSSDPPVVRSVDPGTAAAEAGLKPGDRITRIGGESVSGYGDVYRRLQGAGIDLETFGVDWGRPPIVDVVDEGKPAALAGLRPGDRIEAIDGTPVATSAEVAATIYGAVGRELVLTVRRGEQRVALRVTPVAGKLPTTNKVVGLTGFRFKREAELVRLPPLAALSRGLLIARENAGTLFGVLRHLLIRDGKTVDLELLRDGSKLTLTLRPNLGFSSLQGPIGIATMAREMATGPARLLFFMGFISLQLGVLNLLPIPVLDGGHILFLLTESILRRDLSMQVKERLSQVGFIALVALMVAVFCQDILKRI